MPLRVTNSAVSNNSITITFSGPVDTTGDTSATNLANYTVFDPGSVDFSQPQTIQDVVNSAQMGGSFTATASLDPTNRFLAIAFTPSIPSFSNEFQPGDWVHVTVKNVTGQTPGFEPLEGGHATLARQVPGGGADFRRATRDVEDVVTYPVLTENVSFPRSGGGPTTGASSSQGGGSLGQTAALAIGDVLGWKVSATDPKGFVGALTQAFTLTEVEGRVESSWNPRTFAVQTDLGGGITGAQASLYTRAKDALDQSLQLLDGLYPLDPEADPEYVKALREMARSQMTEIVKEFGAVGLPSILRIDTYFDILLGQHPSRSAPVQFDPDQIKGTLGQLRDTYGIYFRGNPFNNSIEDEQDITNFRVISDYMTSLMQSWIANREFFFVSPNRIAFFGTQLVLISRQLNVIAETVDEVRFALDSVFIGPNERQALLLKFKDDGYPPMFLEDVLEEIERFVEDEGPRLLRDGGKIAVTNNILPVVKALKRMIEQARDPENRRELPDGFKTARVRHSLDDLKDQLGELIKLTEQVEQQVPFPEGDLRITGISTPLVSSANIAFSLFGQAMHPAAKVDMHSDAWTTVSHEFYSAERIDVMIDSTIFAPGIHDIRVTNPDGESATQAVQLPPAAALLTATKPVTTLARRSVAITAATSLTATVGQDYNHTLEATGGEPTYTWAVSAGSLPPGLSLSQWGAVTGKPLTAGPFTFSVTAIDADRRAATKSLTITVAAPVSVTTKGLPDAVLGAHYKQAVQATGGAQTYTWALSGGSLPPGLSLTPAGEILGTPTAALTSTFFVTVTDAAGNTANQPLTIAVEGHSLSDRVDSLRKKVEGLEKRMKAKGKARRGK